MCRYTKARCVRYSNRTLPQQAFSIATVQSFWYVINPSVSLERVRTLARLCACQPIIGRAFAPTSIPVGPRPLVEPVPHGACSQMQQVSVSPDFLFVNLACILRPYDSGQCVQGMLDCKTQNKTLYKSHYHSLEISLSLSSRQD